MKILVLNGANLNLLGKREPEIYGEKTLDDVRFMLEQRFPQVDFEFFQSNNEGELIDKMQTLSPDGAVINPGAFTHYSFALYDCIMAIDYPVIEVHISNIYRRDEFRRKSVTAPACKGVISGLGIFGYCLAVEALVEEGK